MAKNEQLFEESSQGATSAITVIGFLLSCVFVFGGFYLFGAGFNAELPLMTQLSIFAGGLVAELIGWMIPFVFLPAIGK
ncbi:hypothetical protein ICL81_08660 [Leucobacter sp. cx-328]|uniref:hypothetical protein n=1 Tax=unclassified Leucobacter TaxID=2621730 RepID=UPI00165DFEC0|nr:MULTISPECIES: hypothetical protein [unclassified Leucobacter]MBC9944578.1 hypothetical protein [Leucobacter sp. cx-328]MBC9954271.1 hypothetical protein [Leucobacter sp. cx-42]